MQLTQKEIDALESLHTIFESTASNIKAILSEKQFPENAMNEIEYVLKDHTSFIGYQNEWIAMQLHTLNDLYTKIMESKN